MSAIKSAQYLIILGALAIPALATGPGISGTVVNKTTGKAGAGDEVVLIDVSADMREAGRTRSDRLGHFQFHALQGSVPHLVRVIHGGVRYESAISATDHPVDVTVFDSTPAIAGIKTSVQAMQVETAGDNLRVTEMLTVVNSSNPPRTVQRQQLFWLTLPKGATVLASAAQGPEADTLEYVAMAAPDEGRSYFNFPLRPGTTKIQVQYQVPYSGELTFVPHVPFPADTLGVVLPSSMGFESSQLSGYAKDSDQRGDLAEVIHDVSAGNAAPFAISAPTGSASSASTNQSDSLAEALRLAGGFREKARDNRPASSVTSSSAHTQLWTLSILFGVLLLIAIYLYLRRQRTPTPTMERTALEAGKAIKGELFNLESARIQNRISKARYTKSRSMLEKRLGAVSSGVPSLVSLEARKALPDSYAQCQR
jgi:hypothetical protein